MATKRIVSDSGNNSDSAVNHDDASDFDPAALEQSTAQPDAGPDPFDPINLRLSQDFSASIGVKKALLTVPVRKPEKSWFVRTHPDPAYRLQTAVIELKGDQGSPKFYLVAQALWPELAAGNDVQTEAAGDSDQ